MKRILLLLGALLLASRARAGSSSRSGRLAYPNSNGESRGCDPLGCGEFGASRGSRLHRGHDFVVTPGESVRSPIQGRISRHARPYSNDTRYSGVEIIGSGPHQGLRIKMFYLAPGLQVGTTVKPGQAIGVAQNIATKHGQAMKPHIHLELYYNDQAVDPLPFF